MSMQFNSSLEQIDGKIKPRCFSEKAHQFKPPLVPFCEFPSKLELNKKGSSGSAHSINSNLEDTTTNVPTNDKKKKAPITHWRRALHSDEEAITKIIEQSEMPMDDLFMAPDLPDLIEKSSYSLVQINSDEEIISFLSIFPYPAIPAVPSFDWYPWLINLYKLENLNPRNCFFVHYIIWKNEYYHDFLRIALETLFLEYNFLTYLIIIKPPKAKLPTIIPQYFIQVLPSEAENYKCDYNSLQTILLCLRESLLERLKIRLAITEDHDDLMPIAEQHTERLRQLYGDYCLAEIIEYPGTKDRRTLVCESQGYAVGFMIINRAADIELLNSQFDLGAFHGLKKPTKEDKIAEILPEDPEIQKVTLPDKIDPYLEIIDSQTMLKFLNWKPSLNVSEEDLLEVKSSISDNQELGFGELTKSMSNLVRGTLNLKLAPKFSAHALSILESSSTNESESESLSSMGKPFEEDESSEEEVQVQTEPSLISLQYYNLPEYHGPSNAFIIEFFAMHNKFDDRLCRDFIEAAFEEFSDLEYCFLTFPSQAPHFHLLDYFVRVTPRPLKRLRHELYVCHRSSLIIKNMLVRKISKPDLKEIWTFLKGIQNHEQIYADTASSCYYEDSPYQSFVLTCSKVIVGIAVICNEDGMEYLAHHFHVADKIDIKLHKIEYHAILHHLIMSPIFQSHSRYFLRDLLRTADITSLYRVRYDDSESIWNRASIVNILHHLIPVKPRRMVIYHEPSLEPNVPPPYLRFTEIPFSLHHINRRSCSLKKFSCSSNIVVVGSSATAFSFLENLLFSSEFMTFYNITWVAPHGSGTEIRSHPAGDLMFPFEGKYSRIYKSKISLRSYTDFVYGVMTEINRDEKYILINNDLILPYDYLILLCGKQFSMPIPMASLSQKKTCRRNFRRRCSLFKYLITQQPKEEETIKTVYPTNVFLINTEVDATNSLISLQYLYQRKKIFLEKEKIIIYGHHINTYLCTQALLKYGVQASDLAIVEPFPSGVHSVSCFKDDNVDNAVLKTLNELGIDHYKGYFLFDWTLTDTNQVQMVIFHSKNRKVSFRCIAMFAFEKKSVSDVTFKAINEAPLVYDHKLVINNNFQTNDPSIYAAGGLTTYQRKYFANNKNHQYYNSNEVGKHLANIFRSKIDPTVEPRKPVHPDLVPTMTEPLMLYGFLPGDWHYFILRKPGKFLHPETQAGIKDFGDVLQTGDCEMSKGYGYFKLSLDDSGFVSQIICFTKHEIDVDNLIVLYGKHERLLNNLLLRFDLGMIQDFYSYFREPWACAIFHDRFKYLLGRNKQVFYDEICENDEEKLIDTIINVLKKNGWKRPSEEELDGIREKFENSKLHKQVTQNILHFLYCFDEAFPMYATPGILRILLQDASKSLLHRTLDSKVKFADVNAGH